MAEPFLGEIRTFGFNYAPRGWAQCNGQLLPISQYSALFALLGTQFGGDGVRTFRLPDLQGRVGINQGQGPGLSFRSMGEAGGAESVTLQVSQLPAHTHPAIGSSAGGDSLTPSGSVWAPDAAGGSAPYSTGTPDVALAAQAIGPAGSGLPHENVQPYLVLNFCIALEGIFPSRN